MSSENTNKFKQSNDSIKMIIKDQAGEKMKGILEGVQNSFDAMSYRSKSEAIEINFEGDTLTISDKGKGFKKKVDFQMFGTDAKKNIGKKKDELGRFHIGRGQIIAMADLDEDGYSKIEFLTTIRGKKWKFYNIFVGEIGVDDERDVTFEDAPSAHNFVGTKVIVRNSGFSYNGIEKYLLSTLRFFERPISFNGKMITTKLTKKEVKSKWLLDLDIAKIFINDSGDGFKVYNRGIYVNELSVASGYSGMIISKYNMLVNFARNEVEYTDPHWSNIEDEIQNFCTEKAMNHTRLTNSQKSMLIERALNDDDLLDEIRDKKLIKLSNGKFISLNSIGDSVYESEDTFSRKEDKAIQKGYDVVALDYNTEQLLEYAGVSIKKLSSCSVKLGDYKEYKDEEYTELYKKIIKELQRYTDRTVKFGRNNGTMAWTDGSSYIVFNPKSFDLKKWKTKHSKLMWDFLKVLAHEMAHDESDMVSDIHGSEFDENYISQLENIGDKYMKTISHDDIDESVEGYAFDATVHKRQAGQVHIAIPKTIIEELGLLDAVMVRLEVKNVARLNWREL